MPDSFDSALKAMYILGLSAFYHDSAACLIHNGHIIAAAQEERFSRKKHDHRFPENAVAYCLSEAGITISEISHVVFYDKPWLKFERLLETYLSFAPFGLRSFLKSMPLWLKEKLWMGDYIQKALEFEQSVLYPEHHQSHAASAFFPSPFEEAALLTIDGVGEWATASWGYGKGNKGYVTRRTALFLTVWDCCTLRSPITPDLRSILVSIKSWVLRHMENRAMLHSF